MEKYLGLVRENYYSMYGVSETYRAKVSSKKSELEAWFATFHDNEKVEYEKIIIPNFPELEDFFGLYIVPDFTDEEIEEIRNFFNTDEPF